jgi:hypothetical protein
MAGEIHRQVLGGIEAAMRFRAEVLTAFDQLTKQPS